MPVFKRALEKFDRGKQLTKRAHELAQKHGVHTDAISNAGRTLTYYHGMLEKLIEKMGKPKGQSFLHIAGANGLLTRFLQERGARAVNFDYDPKLCDLARKFGNKEVVEGDALKKLPFKHNEFNCLITDHFVFAGYRIVDLGLTSKNKYSGSESIIKEASRVVKPNGIFVINSIDIRNPLPEMMEICHKYFGKVEPYAYGHQTPGSGKDQLVPGLILSKPRKN
jgi:ubiquinone/menaquinone biosynthesis C-methylase UbiE